jgi:hypothetical protein
MVRALYSAPLQHSGVRYCLREASTSNVSSFGPYGAFSLSRHQAIPRQAHLSTNSCIYVSVVWEGGHGTVKKWSEIKLTMATCTAVATALSEMVAGVLQTTTVSGAIHLIYNISGHAPPLSGQLSYAQISTLNARKGTYATCYCFLVTVTLSLASYCTKEAHDSIKFRGAQS